jgi:hypothetical protein
MGTAFLGVAALGLLGRAALAEGEKEKEARRRAAAAATANVDSQTLAKARENYDVKKEEAGWQVRRHKRSGGSRQEGIGGGGRGELSREGGARTSGFAGTDESCAPEPCEDGPSGGAALGAPPSAAPAPRGLVAGRPESPKRASLEEKRKDSDGEARPDVSRLAPLRAGETDDNENFDAYLGYRTELLRENPGLVKLVDLLDISERYLVRVTDEAGRPLPNCRIAVSADDRLVWRGTTTSAGEMPFYPRCAAGCEGATGFFLSVIYGGTTKVVELPRKKNGSDEPIAVTLPCAKQVAPVCLDVVFTIDTTGSMSDEISQIQATLLEITRRIKEMPARPELRFGMVVYRDRTDAYVTKVFPFTSDVSAFHAALQSIGANGGGDGPEALNMGLFDTVDALDWREDALRLSFLIADAPPHMDYGDDVPYGASLKLAVEKGIKVFPVAASGLSEYTCGSGSYIFRQIGQFTMARFIYIEYGDSAASHGVRNASGGNNLDDIVVRTVEKELARYVE